MNTYTSDEQLIIEIDSCIITFITLHGTDATLDTIKNVVIQMLEADYNINRENINNDVDEHFDERYDICLEEYYDDPENNSDDYSDDDSNDYNINENIDEYISYENYNETINENTYDEDKLLIKCSNVTYLTNAIAA